MDFEKTRFQPRDAVMYTLLRDALSAFAKKEGFGRYDSHFATVLGYTSKNGNIQFLSSIQDVSVRRFGLDEFCVLIRELGLESSPIINRMLEGSGLICVSADSPTLDSISSFPVIHLIKSGELASSLVSALQDGALTKKEEVEIFEQIDSIIGFLSSLRHTVKEYAPC